MQTAEPQTYRAGFLHVRTSGLVEGLSPDRPAEPVHFIPASQFSHSKPNDHASSALPDPQGVSLSILYSDPCGLCGPSFRTDPPSGPGRRRTSPSSPRPRPRPPMWRPIAGGRFPEQVQSWPLAPHAAALLDALRAEIRGPRGRTTSTSCRNPTALADRPIPDAWELVTWSVKISHSLRAQVAAPGPPRSDADAATARCGPALHETRFRM